MFGGGAGGGVPSRFSRIHLPRTTGDVRSGYDVTVRMLPCPSRPPRRLSGGSVDAPEPAALHVGNAVVAREPFVDERVVGAQQVERAAILADHALEEQLRLAAERLTQRVVEVGKALLHRNRGREVLAETATARRSSRRTCRTGDRRSSGEPAGRARRGRRAASAPRASAAPRRECCSTGRTTAATRARDR